MELKGDSNHQIELSRQLFLIGTPRDPLVSAGAIVASNISSDDINSTEEIQPSSLVSLMEVQSPPVCFPTKFRK